MVSIPIDENGLLAIESELLTSPTSNEEDISLHLDPSSPDQSNSGSCEIVACKGNFSCNLVYYLDDTNIIFTDNINNHTVTSSINSPTKRAPVDSFAPEKTGSTECLIPYNHNELSPVNPIAPSFYQNGQELRLAIIKMSNDTNSCTGK